MTLNKVTFVQLLIKPSTLLIMNIYIIYSIFYQSKLNKQMG